MAGSALGMTFSLLLLAAITQGHKDDEESHNKSMEAVVGQSVTLPCSLKNKSDVKFVSVEWRRKTGKDLDTKLAVYSPVFGQYRFTQNLSLKIETDDADKGFNLYIPLVKKYDSGLYICDITTFPLGSLRSETELKVKDVDNIVCDVEGTVEVHYGENVIIRCQFLPNIHYEWTKDNVLVSKKENLELLQVTNVHAGVYTLSVNTGTKNLQKEFNIIVRTVTTSPTDLTTASPQSNVTREGLIDSADSSSTTSEPTGPRANDTGVTRAANTSTDVTDVFSNSKNVTATTGDYRTTFINDTHINVTSSPDPYNLPNSTLSVDGPVFSTTQEMSSDDTSNESTPYTAGPDGGFSVTPDELNTVGNLTETFQNPLKKTEPNSGIQVEDNARSHLLAVIIIPVLVLIAVVGFLYRRHIVKQRMDLPPPFKPPPPPVKYVAVGQSESSAKSFPVSRCDSVPFFY